LQTRRERAAEIEPNVKRDILLLLTIFQKGLKEPGEYVAYGELFPIGHNSENRWKQTRGI